MALQHFLLVYDLGAQRLIDRQEFEDGNEAATAYAALEHRYKGRDDLEIVLVGADSIDTIRRTHAHYFDAVETASPFLAA